MRLLAIDTASRAGSMAVMQNEEIAGALFAATEEDYSTRLFREVNFLLAELSLGLRDFDVFAVAAGPGSFTGLRVGLAAVKGWAEVFDKPIVAVSGLEAVAAQARGEPDVIAAVLDARRAQIYGGLYTLADGGLRREADEQVSAADEFIEFASKSAHGRTVRFVSPTPRVIEEPLRRAVNLPATVSPAVEAASPMLAPVIASIAMQRASRNEFTDALHLDANYIRRSDAELLWKGP